MAACIVLLFSVYQENSNERGDQEHWGSSDKQPFKRVKGRSENGGFRVNADERPGFQTENFLGKLIFCLTAL